MIFSDLVDRFAEKSGRTKSESKEIMDRVMEVVMETLLNKEEISIYGFGKMEIRQTKPRHVNGFDGTTYTVDPRYKLFFVTSKTFERRINGESEEE